MGYKIDTFESPTCLWREMYKGQVTKIEQKDTMFILIQYPHGMSLLRSI